MVAASGGLVLVSSIGASLGPATTSILMEVFGPDSFLKIISMALIAVTLFALWRATQRDAIVGDTVGEFTIIAPSPINAVLNPSIELDEIESSRRREDGNMEDSFEQLVEELNSKENP